MKSSIRMLLEILQEERERIAYLEGKIESQKTAIASLRDENSRLSFDIADLKTKDRVQNPDPSATLVRELLGPRHVDSDPESNLQRIRKIIRALTCAGHNTGIINWSHVPNQFSGAPLTHEWSSNAGTPDIVKIIV